MFFFFKMGLLACGFFLGFCLLLDLLWLFVGLLFFGDVAVSFARWWAYCLAMIPLWILAGWVAFYLYMRILQSRVGG